jgi:HEAT repeat protein
MKCEFCDGAAVTHVTSIVDGKRTESHVCLRHAPRPDDATAEALAAAERGPQWPSVFLTDAELSAAIRDRAASRDLRRRLLPELIGALLSENPAVRVLSTYSLAAFEEDAAEALDALRAATRDPDDRVRRGAACAVAHIERHVPPPASPD